VGASKINGIENIFLINVGENSIKNIRENYD
jgi:hypothetical protein